MISDDIFVVYLTFADMDQAAAIGRVLVEEQLVACINLLPGATSLYHWDNAVRERQEVVAFAKTTADQFDAIVMRVQALHAYDTPCVVGWPLAQAAEAYAQYVSVAVR